MLQQKRIKSLRNSDDRADQKKGQNDDNTLGIPRANLQMKDTCSYYVHNMFIIWSLVHNLFHFGAMINR